MLSGSLRGNAASLFVIRFYIGCLFGRVGMRSLSRFRILLRSCCFLMVGVAGCSLENGDSVDGADASLIANITAMDALGVRPSGQGSLIIPMSSTRSE